MGLSYYICLVFEQYSFKNCSAVNLMFHQPNSHYKQAVLGGHLQITQATFFKNITAKVRKERSDLTNANLQLDI